MSTGTKIFAGSDLCGGGLNDTVHPALRRHNQAKTFQNMRIMPDGSARKIDGRKDIATGFNSVPTGLIVPPKVIPLVTVYDGVNDRLLFTNTVDGVTTEYAATIAAAEYSTYALLAAAIKSAINTAAGSEIVDIDYGETAAKKFTFDMAAGNAIVIRWPKRKYAKTPTMTTGSGTDDIQVGGIPEKVQTYLVKISTAYDDDPPTTEKFQWKISGDAAYADEQVTATTATYLKDGLTVQWPQIETHTVNNEWTIAVDETNIDWAEKIGFRSGLSIAAGGTGTSEFEVDEEPPYQRGICLADRWHWGSAATEITTPRGFRPLESPEEVVGYWHQDRWYGSNGVENYLLRDKYLRRSTPNDSARLGQTISKTASESLSVYLEEGAVATACTLGPLSPRKRLALGTLTTIYAPDTVKIKMKVPDSTTGHFLLKLYYEIPSLGYKQYLADIIPGDIAGNDTDGYGDVTVSTRFVCGVGASTDDCLLLEYVPMGTDLPLVYIGMADSTANVTSQDQNGVWTAEADKWIGSVAVTGVLAQNKYAKVRFSLTNREGYESQLSESYPFEMAQDFTALVTSGTASITDITVNAISNMDGTATTAFAIACVPGAAPTSYSYVVSFVYANGTLAKPTNGAGPALRTIETVDPRKSHISGTTVGMIADGTAGVKRILLSTGAVAHSFTTAGYVTTYAAWDVFDDGTNVYVAYGKRGLVVLSSAALALVGGLVVAGQAVAIEKSGSYCYLACSEAGLKIVNVTTPATPTLTATKGLGYESNARDVCIIAIGGSTYALVAAGKQGMVVVDVTTPAVPETVGSYKTAVWTSVKDAAGTFDAPQIMKVVASDTRAYCATDKGTVLEIDISDPSQPKLVNTFKALGGIKDINIAGDADNKWLLIATGTGGLKAINIFNTATVSTYSTSYYGVNVRVPDADDDWEFLNIYRTASQPSYGDAENAACYLWARVHRDQILGETGQAFTVNLGGTDETLTAGIEGNLTSPRTTKLPYRNVTWWDNRPWASGLKEVPHVLYWGRADSVEAFNIADNWMAIGQDSQPIIGHAPAGDRMVVFKRNAFHEIFSLGNGLYGQRLVNDDGIGSLGPRSIIGAITPEGNLVYFQGQNGHFYATNGQGLLRLSEGDPGKGIPPRLETLVASLNMSYLHKTYAFMSPATGEIVWAVCTGANTAPDKLVVYNPTFGAFSTETMAGGIFAVDYLTAGEINILGSGYVGSTPANRIFQWRKLDYDLASGSDIEAIWESADYNLGNKNTRKHFRTWADQAVSKIARTNDRYVAAGTAGLDDCTIDGYPSVAGRIYRVKISTASTTDKIDISNDGGSTWARTGVSIVAGTAMTLASDDTVTATFLAATGHSINDYWQTNSLTMTWYLDGSTTAAGMAYVATGTDVAEVLCRYLGRATTIRIKLSATDDDGWWQVSMREIESEYIRKPVR